MTNLFKRYQWLRIVTACLLIAAGILIIVWGVLDTSRVNAVLSITVACLFFVLGAIFLVSGILVPLSRLYDTSFIYAAVSIAIGVVLLLNQNIVGEVLLYTLAVSILVFGLIYLIRGIVSAVQHGDTKAIILDFVFAVIAIVLGVLCLIFRSQVTQYIYIVAGCVITVMGVSYLVTSLYHK